MNELFSVEIHFVSWYWFKPIVLQFSCILININAKAGCSSLCVRHSYFTYLKQWLDSISHCIAPIFRCNDWHCICNAIIMKLLASFYTTSDCYTSLIFRCPIIFDIGSLVVALVLHGHNMPNASIRLMLMYVLQ